MILTDSSAECPARQDATQTCPRQRGTQKRNKTKNLAQKGTKETKMKSPSLPSFPSVKNHPTNLGSKSRVVHVLRAKNGVAAWARCVVAFSRVCAVSQTLRGSCDFFSEMRCQKNGLAYTLSQMAGIMGLDVKKVGHFIPPRLAQSNGSQKLP
jgi:hypothetical protein